MNDNIAKINNLRNVKHSELAPLVRKVAVVLSSPRSGSSFIKAVLDSHPQVASLNGEIEPFLILTRNGFGFNSDSDALENIAHQTELADNIFDDLSIDADSPLPASVLKQKWQKRFLLQYPAVFATDEGFKSLCRSLDEVLPDGALIHSRGMELQAAILTKVFEDTPWRIHFYDGYLKLSHGRYFDEVVKIEEPPFVVPRENRRPFDAEDAKTKTILFKTPPDVFRMGMYEALFPNAEIQYIHLTRGFAQVVNGLMDGWLSPNGFFSHNMKQKGEPLNIRGYSDILEFGKDWWKFDLPPNWREFKNAHLEDVCFNQWASAHQTILTSKKHMLRISFEEFLVDPSTVALKVTQYLGLEDIQLQSKLPIVMATEAPKKKRWEKRKDLLLKMADRREVRDLMTALNYEMNPDIWI